MARGNQTIVYIDGFNLYYGALRGGPHKWLDLERYFDRLRPHDDVLAINYFTAVISGPRQRNQDAYLQALATLPRVNVFLGRFKQKRIHCRATGCTFSGDRRFEVPEEKRTDVNIAVRMVDDAHRSACDHMVLVSGDSDLVPAINVVKTAVPDTEVIVYVPARHAVRGAAVELRAAADRDKTLPLQLMKHAQFPAVITGHNTSIHKPADW